MGRLLDPLMRTATLGARRMRRQERAMARRRQAAGSLFDDAASDPSDEPDTLEEFSETELVEELPDAEDESVGRTMLVQSATGDDTLYVGITSWDGTPQFVPVTTSTESPYPFLGRIAAGLGLDVRAIAVNPGAVLDAYGGTVYVTDIAGHRVVQFDELGNLLAQTGSLGSGDANFNTPLGIAVDSSNGVVWVADTLNHRIKYYSGGLSYGSKLGSLGAGVNQFNSPYGVAVNPVTGNTLVADTGNNRVVRLNGPTWVAAFGSAGSGAGQFNGPTGVAVDADSGQIFVADLWNARVQRFGSDGVWQATYVVPAGVQPAPANIAAVAVDAGTDTLFATESGGARVHMWRSTDGAYVGWFGRYGKDLGQFGGTFGVAFAPRWGLFVVDYVNDWVERFGNATTVARHTHWPYFIRRGSGTANVPGNGGNSVSVACAADEHILSCSCTCTGNCAIAENSMAGTAGGGCNCRARNLSGTAQSVSAAATCMGLVISDY